MAKTINDKKQIYEKALKEVDKNKLIFIEDLIAYLGISKPTFYSYFKVGSNEFNSIKELIDKNKINIKVGLRSKWYKSENTTAQIALYKLCANEEELERLNNKEKVAGEEMPKIEIKLNGINEKTK